MNKSTYKTLILGAIFFLASSFLALWSWNTLSELFSLPQAQYKHAIAALILAFTIKWIFFHKHQTLKDLLSEHHGHSTS